MKNGIVGLSDIGAVVKRNWFGARKRGPPSTPKNKASEVTKGSSLERVSVRRSDGGISSAEIVETTGKKSLVKFLDTDGAVRAKTVDTSSLMKPLKTSNSNLKIGDTVSVKRSSGNRSNATIVKTEEGRIRVQFQENGQTYQKRVRPETIGNPSSLREKMKLSGNDSIDNFRKAYNSNSFDSSSKYVSVRIDGLRLNGKVKSVDKSGNIHLQVNEGGKVSEKVLSPSEAEFMKVSDSSAKLFKDSHNTVKESSINMLIERQKGGPSTFDKAFPGLKNTSPRGPPRQTSSASYSEKSLKRVVNEYNHKLPKDYEDGGQYLSLGYWRQWMGGKTSELPAQGWKLHVSAKTENAEEIMNSLLPALRKNKVPHKVIEDLGRYHKQSGTQTGKFITIYPKTLEEAKALAKLTAKKIKSKKLSKDKFTTIPGEKEISPGVFVRYGRITGEDLRDKYGNASTEKLLNNKDELVPDTRGSYKPEWVDNPF